MFQARQLPRSHQLRDAPAEIRWRRLAPGVRDDHRLGEPLPQVSLGRQIDCRVSDQCVFEVDDADEEP